MKSFDETVTIRLSRVFLMMLLSYERHVGFVQYREWALVSVSLNYCFSTFYQRGPLSVHCSGNESTSTLVYNPSSNYVLRGSDLVDNGDY